MLSQAKLNAMKIIREEFKQLNRKPLQNLGITVGLFDEDNIFEWKCTIIGPTDTCYKGGLFHLKIKFPDDYPNSQPEIIFLSPIYHLNVKYFVGNEQPLGHICVSTLNFWNPGDSVINNRALFEEKAKHFTKKYASPHLMKIKEYPNGWDFTY